VLRSAVATDVDALLDLERASFSGDRLSRRQLRHLLSGRAHGECLVWAEEGDVLGAVVVLYRSNSRRARVYSIAVAPAARGRGVGRQLLAAAERAARARGCHALRAEIRHDNPASVALFSAASYRCFGERPGYYEDGMHAWRYCKELKTDHV
jgi:[ribosomal protein S18]-alanine N-acetyltransferase